MFTIGIDPGVSGGVAIVSGSAAKLVTAVPMPVMLASKSSTKQAVDVHDLARLLRAWVTESRGDIQAMIEDVHAMPGQGVTSMFSFGRGVGRVEGVIAALGVSIEYVTPGLWKRYYRLGAEKDQARTLAQQLYPEQNLARKKDHGVAEALLIARYAAMRGGMGMVDG
jgi:crossover junction endodeoxyribonuclease RuvC